MQSEKLRHVFFKSLSFKRDAERLNAWNEIDRLKLFLDKNPEYGAVIPGGDGLRKIRMAIPGKGKRGGARVIYFQILDQCIFLIDVFAKNEKSDLRAIELKNAIEVRNGMLIDYKEFYHGKNAR